MTSTVEARSIPVRFVSFDLRVAPRSKAEVMALEHWNVTPGQKTFEVFTNGRKPIKEDQLPAVALHEFAKGHSPLFVKIWANELLHKGELTVAEALHCMEDSLLYYAMRREDEIKTGNDANRNAECEAARERAYLLAEAYAQMRERVVDPDEIDSKDPGSVAFSTYGEAPKRAGIELILQYTDLAESAEV